MNDFLGILTDTIRIATFQDMHRSQPLPERTGVTDECRRWSAGGALNTGPDRQSKTVPAIGPGSLDVRRHHPSARISRTIGATLVP